MYTVAVKRNFIAQHFLTGGDWGSENVKHSHHYQVEVQLEGEELDEHGYLMDIVDIENNLEGLADYYSDHLLNEIPEFQGINPSLEHFSRIFWQMLSKRIQAPNVNIISIKIWENDLAWASYRKER